MENSQKRNSNLELLRVISMLLIITHHYAHHGFNGFKLYMSFNKYVVDILSLGGKIGVSCFILISGYFMINSKFTIKKLWKLIGKVLFYSIGILILFLTVFRPVENISFAIIKKSLFPITFSAYWFVTCYVVLMIISPYINKFIYACKKEELKKFIILMTFLWSIIGTLTKATLEFSNLGWFIVLYCTSAYIKLYYNFDKKKILRNKIILFISASTLVVSSIIFNKFGQYSGIAKFIPESRYLSNLNSILVLIISVSMFLCFAGKKKFSSTFINETSKCVLGVYLIHDNLIFRPYLWKVLLRNSAYYSSNTLIIHAIISIFLVFVVCTIFDFIRIKLVEPLWMKIYDFLEKIVLKHDFVNCQVK